MVDPLPKARATISLDLQAGSPVGSIATENGTEHPFFGWMELAGAIEAWKGVLPEPGPDEGEDSHARS